MSKKQYKKSKKKKQNKMRIYTVLMVVCVCAFTLVYRSYLDSDFNTDSKPAAQTGAPVATKQQATASVTDSDSLLNDKQTMLLQNYAQQYATTLVCLEPQSIADLYADTSSEAYVVNKTAFDLLVSIRKMKDTDLSLEYADVQYTIDRVETEKGKTTVYLYESNTQKFRHLTQPSYSADLYHQFTLIEKDGSWFIEKHYHEEDFYLLTMEGWEDATGADNAHKGENTLQLLIADAQENLADLSQFQQGEYRTDLTVADTSYNRDAAVAYAQQWWNKRNYTTSYLAYDDFGGNCQNFASQCLYAGGIKMDYTGTHDQQWKFFDQDLNNKATATGRSYSWTGVDMFYSYALINYKSGLVALSDVDYKYAEKGDIIHVGAYYHWRHALLITDVLYNADGTQQDIIVASNTADRWNYPLSAYIYTAPRLIHILGQN